MASHRQKTSRLWRLLAGFSHVDYLTQVSEIRGMALPSYLKSEQGIYEMLTEGLQQ